MKTPPPVDEHVRRTRVAAVTVERDPRFLVFASLVLVALALGFKSELVSPGRVWFLAAGLLAVAAPALFGYLRAESGASLPAVEYYVPAVLGALAVAGLSLIIPEWWRYGLAVLVFGTCFMVSSRLDFIRLADQAKRGHHFMQESILAVAMVGVFVAVLSSPFNLALKLAWIGIISVLAAFRSFRVSGDPIPPRRAFLFALIVAQVVTFFAWAIFFYLQGVAEGVFAGMLLLAWYINRGVIRHTAEESLNRHVVMEYGLFAVLLAFLFFSSYRPGG